MQYDHTRKIKSNSPNSKPPFTSGTREPENQTAREQIANNNDSQDHKTTRHPGYSQIATDTHSVSRGISTSLQSGTEGQSQGRKRVEEKWREQFEGGRYHDIPLLAYVRLAYEESTKNTWEKNRKSPTWEFLRYLKARVEFDDCLEPEEALSDILHFIDLTEEEQLTIAKEWDKVEAPAGMGPLEWALKMARAHPLKNPPGPKLPTYVTFVSIAAYLQLRRDKPILLPVNELARILQTKPQTISTLRKLAKRYGLLKEVAPYLIKRRATEFRFAVDKFPELKERQ